MAEKAPFIMTGDFLEIIGKWISAPPGAFVIDLRIVQTMVGQQFKALTDKLLDDDKGKTWIEGRKEGPNKPTYLLTVDGLIKVLEPLRSTQAIAVRAYLVQKLVAMGRFQVCIMTPSSLCSASSHPCYIFCRLRLIVQPRSSRHARCVYTFASFALLFSVFSFLFSLSVSE
jgi:hypothetical protein